MAGVNETPRQKMMGILYLVLLGLAATTVTDHVLDAFRNLTVSLKTSSENVQVNVDQAMSAFEAGKLKNEPDRARPVWEKAQKVKASIESLNKMIEEIKNELTTAGGGLDEQGDIKARADIDISPRMMVRKGRAKELRAKIEATRKEIIAQLPPSKDGKEPQLALDAKDPERGKGGVKSSWEETNFGDGIPLTASITALTKIQADMRNTEAEAVKKILGEVDKAVINLDQFDAVAIAPTSYVLVGQQYTAEVFLTASDSKSNPEVSVGGSPLKVLNGKGQYTVSASREGEFKWSGTVKVKMANGEMKEYKTKEQTYTVARPSAVVSPDKMNVFYIGVPNPVSVSAPGFSKDKIKVSMSAGEISGTGGNYTVKVSSPGKVTVTVSGVLDGGKTAVLGTTEFRIKRIPPPRVKFSGKAGGRLSVGEAKVQNRIFAVLEDFDFEAAFNIQHFKLYIVKPRADAQVFESTNNAFTPAMTAAMAGVVSGTRLIFDDVFATGPDGVKRPLDPITFNIQ
ncbi:gliding motility protein GldM [Nemorincola caseinilytica]|uniref:Gliding motility protein GldM n=1 Tax=Nemorincola caseinilytica TaxID=2054315 RepID=A0ABP8NH48_9BACT